jgi:hypothetical protein
LIEGLDEARKAITDKNNEMISKIKISKENYRKVAGRFGVFKMGGFLKKLMERYFGYFKNYNRIVDKVNAVLGMLHNRIKVDLNYGFIRIELRSYEVLKIAMQNRVEDNKLDYSKI